MKTDLRCSRREFLALSVAAAGLGPLVRDSRAATEPVGPPRTAPLAMWALTGTLKSDDVRRQLDAFHGAGWGVVLYPRWGLELEYLGAVWFERIRFIAEQAAARRMEVWLYDEFCWPSGHAKGLVTQDHTELEAQLLAVGRDGTSRIVPVPGSANLLLPQATARFLAVTHEQYARAVGEFFGTTVRAIFTDEPSLQHQPRKPGNVAWQLTWSSALDKALGGDFQQRLAHAGEVARAPLWREYWAAYTRVFHDAWVAPIAQWCAAHKLAMTGHLLGEHSFGSQVACNGSVRRQLGAFGIPGIDEIRTQTDPASCEALTLATIAEFTGRERMVEVYALGPPTMSLATMKQMVDLCAACGVDRYVLAICPHDFRGGVFKREYLGVHGPQQPWFRDAAKMYAEYVAEAAAVARAAKPLGVPWPADDELWAVAGPDPARSEPLKEMTQRFVESARERIRARLERGHAPVPPVARKTLEADWTFQPDSLNCLRLDAPGLTVVDVPRVAELSVQSQLVRVVRINGTAINLDAAPVDHQFDLSYRRVPVAGLLHSGENRIEADLAEPKPLRFLPALILWGDFAVDAQGRIITPPQTIKLGDWRSQGYPAFCGTGRYRAEVKLDVRPQYLGVNTSDYPVSVIWNGQRLGHRAWPPYRFALANVARVGRNEIIIEVTSTLGHLLTPKEAPPIGLLTVWTE